MERALKIELETGSISWIMCLGLVWGSELWVQVFGSWV